jgi:DUF1009 family protein
MTIGIIAGGGNAPFDIIKALKDQGINHKVISIKGFCNEEALLNFHRDFLSHKIGQVAEVLNFCKNNNISKIIMIGKVSMPNFKNLSCDFEGAKIVARITKAYLFGDDTVLSIVEKYLNENGIEIISPLSVINYNPDELLRKVCNNITKEQMSSVNLGINILKDLSKYDIGQGIIVENMRVISIEGQEGTDEMIERSAKYLKHKNGVLVKMPKINQNIKLDLPTIGINTFLHARDSNIRTIAISKTNMLFLDQSECIEFAKNNNINIMFI